MKVCTDHINKVRRGSTYQIVNKDECIFCKNPYIKSIGEVW
jgi:hypothetical protein